MRVILYTDSHHSEVAPKSRCDDYGAAIAAKLDWISDYGNEIGADLFIDNGDLTDRATQSIEELMTLHRIHEKRKAPTITVVGNHPIRGNVNLWKPKSGVYALSKLLKPGHFEILDAWKGDITVAGKKIRLHHTDLMRRPITIKGWKHILWSDYDHGGADLVMVGHYHPRQGIHRVNGAWFVSPGALSRGSLAEDNLKRVPKIVVIDIGAGGQIDFKWVTVPHRPAAEVFDTSALLTVQDVIQDHEALQECVNTLKEMESEGETTVSVYDLLKLVRGGMAISDEAYDLAVEKLKEVVDAGG